MSTDENNSKEELATIFLPLKSRASNSPARMQSDPTYSTTSAQPKSNQNTQDSMMGTMTLPMHTNTQWGARDRPAYDIPSEPRSAASNISLPSIHHLLDEVRAIGNRPNNDFSNHSESQSPTSTYGATNLRGYSSSRGSVMENTEAPRHSVKRSRSPHPDLPNQSPRTRSPLRRDSTYSMTGSNGSARGSPRPSHAGVRSPRHGSVGPNGSEFRPTLPSLPNMPLPAASAQGQRVDPAFSRGTENYSYNNAPQRFEPLAYRPYSERASYESSQAPPRPTYEPAYPPHVPQLFPSYPQNYSSGGERSPFTAGQPFAASFNGEAGRGTDTRQRRRRGNLPRETTDKLRAWFHNHLTHPYPTEDEKQELMRQTGLQMNQISNWFINARRRQLPAMINNARSEINARVATQTDSMHGESASESGEDRERSDDENNSLYHHQNPDRSKRYFPE